ncbi:AraC family transcriptional regulator [Erwinia billingiae]|uniref:AraC family transcriptional regulator n=1 Tax=Erwinia billingiae TaxID=182337 RepID=UPI0032093472
MQMSENYGSLDCALREMSELINCHALKEGENRTRLEDLTLFRVSEPTQPDCWLYDPSVAIIARGHKRITLGGQSFEYNPSQFLLTAIDMPTITQVLSATPEEPYLGLLLKIDLQTVTQLLVDNNEATAHRKVTASGIGLSPVDCSLADAFNRLLRLLDEPCDIAVMAPMIRREILYRIIRSDCGERLRQMAVVGSQGHKVNLAIRWLKENYNRPLRIEDLADSARMSSSTLHVHFRNITSMSPLQYQKWLRLNEARRLLLAGNMDVTHVAFSVGYESPAHFNRDYSRLFGDSPLRDARKLRQGISGT